VPVKARAATYTEVKDMYFHPQPIDVQSTQEKVSADIGGPGK